jgi:hemerythrin
MIRWNNKMSVHVESIDDQHKWIFDTIAKIQEDTDVDLAQLTMELFKYCRNHFADEEKHMKEIDFPYLAQHVEKHSLMITKLNNFSEKSIANPKELKQFAESYSC